MRSNTMKYTLDILIPQMRIVLSLSGSTLQSLGRLFSISLLHPLKSKRLQMVRVLLIVRTYIQILQKRKSMPRATGSAYKYRPNVTVVPIRFEEPQQQVTSPRNHLKTKLKLVSPSIRNSATHFKQNYPPISPRGESIIKTASVQIELGGKGNDNKAHRRNRQSGDLYPSRMLNSRDRRSHSKEIIEQSFHKGQKLSVNGKNNSGSFLRPTSPQRISIHYAPIPTVFQPITIFQANQAAQIQQQPIRVTPPPFQQSQANKPKINSIYNLPSELAIKEENTMENLRESYESELREIKKLQEEISSNNQQIKQLLKSSKASRNSGHSNKDFSQKGQEPEDNLTESREPSIWAQEQRRQAIENTIVSKKTLINDLKIHTTNKLQKMSSSASKSNGEVSVQTDNCLPADPDTLQEANTIAPKLQRLSLTKNEECQILIQAYSERTANEEKNSLKASIIHESKNSLEEHQIMDKSSEQQRPITQSRKSQRSQLGKSKRSAVKVSPLKISQHSQNTIGLSFEKQKSFQSVERIASVIDVNQVKQITQEKVEYSPIPVSQEILPTSTALKDQTHVIAVPVGLESAASKKSIPKESSSLIAAPPPAIPKKQQPRPSQISKQMRKISNRIYL